MRQRDYASFAYVALTALILPGCATVEPQRDVATAVAQVTDRPLQSARHQRDITRFLRQTDRVREARARHRYHVCAENDYVIPGRYCPRPPGVVGALEQRVQVTGSRIRAADVITNNQETGVDEGDIVKKLGDFIVVLRQGRLHSVRIARGGWPMFEQVDSIGVISEHDSESVWIDEVLTFDGGLLVLAFNYGESRSEILPFALTPAGRFERRPKLFIASDDYYQYGNYGARITGDTLVMVMATGMDSSSGYQWPTWRRESDAGPWKPLVSPRGIYLPPIVLDRPVAYVALQCSLEALLRTTLDCASTGILADHRSELYVSATAMYLSFEAVDPGAYLDPFFSWWDPTGRVDTITFRLPFSRPRQVGAVTLEGRQGSQFAFKEQGGSLYVATEQSDDEGIRSLILHRVPDHAFTGEATLFGPEVARLPVDDAHRTIRFTERFLWIGAHGGVLRDNDASSFESVVFVQPLAGGPVHSLQVPHSVDLVEPVGPHVFLSGATGDRQWQVTLGSETPVQLGDSLTVPAYSPDATWSHEFNFASLADDTWTIGMPAVRPAAVQDQGSRWRTVSDLVFFQIDGRRIRWSGAFEMAALAAPAEDCAYSCYDWYGNARVFFVDGRIFALSADVLAEGELSGSHVTLRRHVNLH